MPNAEKYYSNIMTFPTFTFYEYDIIEKYIGAIKEYCEENSICLK